MDNFCIICGAKLRKEDNFCTNCGTKIKKEDNFCTNCGTKIKKGDNFCTNCGTKIDKSDRNQNNLFKTVQDSIKENESRIAKEKEEEKKKLKMIDEIFESEEIRLQIRNNNIYLTDVISIKNTLKNKIINENEKMSEREIKNFIKTEFRKVSKKQEKPIIKKERIISKETDNNGGYCNLNCIHCFEEFLDSEGGIVGDFDSAGMVEYYCNLGHPVSYGSFCKYYE